MVPSRFEAITTFHATGATLDINEIILYVRLRLSGNK